MIRRLSDSFAANYAFLLALTAALAARSIPYANEWIYLLRLEKVYRPGLFLNDASFSVPADEHWLFNHLFGGLTFLFSIEVVGWMGRISCWVVLLYALTRLARNWDVPVWMSTAAISIWLLCNQSIVGEEWMIGTFEAKCVAYICLLFALDGFSRGRTIVPGILLGLTFSFHPAVGTWAALGVGLSLLWMRRPVREILTVVGLTLLFAVPALIALAGEVARPASPEDWKFIELVRFPHVFDPFSWPKSLIAAVLVHVAFLIWIYRKGDRPRKFLTGFIGALSLFFIAGFVVRGVEAYSILRLMPMRLLPVFSLLFFLLTVGEAYRKRLLGPPLSIAAVLGVAGLLLMPSPVSRGTEQLTQTVSSWSQKPDDTAIAYKWIRDNTANGTIVIAPPYRQDFWHIARRAQVASSGFPTYVDLTEWRERVELLCGESVANRNRLEIDRRPDFYNSLSPVAITAISARSGATLLVTEGEYEYPVLFQAGKARIYQLPKP